MTMNEKRYEAGLKNIEFHLSNADALAREANQTLSILLAAGLGALGYTARLIETSAQGVSPLAWAVGAVAVYLVIIAALIVHYCLAAGDIHPPTNEPKNLLVAGYTWDEILEVELEGMQRRIEANAQRNQRRGTMLNQLRYAAFASPLIFAGALVLALRVLA